MESKYNLLTRLLKNIKNVVNPDGSVSGGVLVVNVNSNGNTHTLNKTFAEILEAFTNTGVVLVKKYQGKYYHIVVNTVADDEFNEYSVFINGDEGMQNFTTNTRTGYPVYTA